MGRVSGCGYRYSALLKTQAGEMDLLWVVSVPDDSGRKHLIKYEKRTAVTQHAHIVKMSFSFHGLLDGLTHLLLYPTSLSLSV